MHITLETDYAIRIVLYLARAGQRADAKKISEETDVTLRFALKILRKLVASDLVHSFKGIKGGYEIARPPEQISLYDIVCVVEGNCYLSRCLDPAVGCNRHTGCLCKVGREFGRVSDLLRDELSAVTVDTLV